jgi:hypothetical protein
MKQELFAIRGAHVKSTFSVVPPGSFTGCVLLNNGGQAPSRRTCCFLTSANRRGETQPFKGEGQWVAVGPARVIHRGVPP